MGPVILSFITMCHFFPLGVVHRQPTGASILVKEVPVNFLTDPKEGRSPLQIFIATTSLKASMLVLTLWECH